VEQYKFNAQMEKLEGVCDENKLVSNFSCTGYPISLTIRPNNGVGEQLSMLAQSDEKGYISPGSYIRFAYVDGSLEYEIAGRFPIDDELFSKLKRIFIRMHSFWTQVFFREMITRRSIVEGDIPRVKNDGVYNGKPLDDDDDAGDDGDDQSDAGEDYPGDEAYVDDDDDEGDGSQPLYNYEPAESEGA